MKTSNENMREIERLLSEYKKEVNEARKNGFLVDNTAKTYLLHAEHFVRWCRDDFEPGGTNKRAK